jgi:hypothetical protein
MSLDHVGAGLKEEPMVREKMSRLFVAAAAVADERSISISFCHVY